MSQNISGEHAKGVQADSIHSVIINQSIDSKIPKALTILPAKNEHFVGRKKELTQLDDSFTHDGALFIITGIGGVGKSELAHKYLLDNKYKYQHIALFNLEDSKSSLADILYNKLKEPLSLKTKLSIPEVVQYLQNLPKKCLLVFDGLNDEKDIIQLQPLNYNCDVLITTRLQLSNLQKNRKNYLSLNTLSPKDSHELFLTYYSMDEKIDDILEHIDYHPLFIKLIAKTLYEGYIALNELREKLNKGEFSKISCDFKQTFNDFLIKRFAIEQQPDLKTLLQQLAILPPIAIEYEVLAEIFTDTQRLKLMLAELAKRGWLIKKDNSYKLHQIIKEFILANHKLDFDEIIPQAIDPDKIDDIEIIDAILAAYPKEENVDIATLRNTQGIIYDYWEQYYKASDTLQIALKIRETLLGEQHPDTATVYNNLAVAYKSQGKLAQAITLHQKALTIRETLLGEQHSDTAISYNNLAETYRLQGKLDQALTLHQKALTINETLLGEQHPDTATSYNNLAVAYKSQGKLAQAITLHQKALTIRETLLGEQHPDTASSYHNLALVYDAKGKWEQAITLHQKAITIRETLFGEQHPDTVRSYNNLAYAYESQGQFEQAITLYQKAVAIRENQLGEQHPDTATLYHNLAYAYDSQGQFEQAITLYQKALTIRETLLGEQHPDTAASYHNLASAYVSQGKVEQAITLYQKALTIHKKRLGNQHPNTIIIRNNLASAYKKTKKPYLTKIIWLIIIITLLIVFIF